VGREGELAVLRDSWTAADARLIVLWGRRRVGKTELLNHFLKGRRALYFKAADAARRDQLRDLSRELARVSPNPPLPSQSLGDWEAALAAIEHYVSAERTVVVLDEFQYLAARDKELESLLNHWWRTTGRRLPLVLVIAGSDVVFFERRIRVGDNVGVGVGDGVGVGVEVGESVRGGDGVRGDGVRVGEGLRGGEHAVAHELYRWSTGQLRVAPLAYRSAALFTPRYGADDKLRTYAVCGGIPRYLECFDDGIPLSENILRHILYRDGFMHDEAELLLRQELREPHNYFSTLRAIAAGRGRSNEIMEWTGLDSAPVRQITAVLERLALVEQRRPVTAGPRSKKTTYAISDGFLRFHFRFVEPYRSLLRTRTGAERHLRQTVLPQLDDFVSEAAFAEVCASHLRAAEPEAVSVGAWWGAVPRNFERRTERRELDAVAVNHRGFVIAVGICNWTTDQLGLAEEALLTGLQGYVAGHYVDRSRIRHYFYARSGFDESLRRLAGSDPGRYRLVSAEDLYR